MSAANRHRFEWERSPQGLTRLVVGRVHFVHYRRIWDGETEIGVRDV